MGQYGADFRVHVYEIIRVIPSGRVMSYGSIASLIPKPAGMDYQSYRRVRARWVGYAMADCPDDLPWHRVVNAKGGISQRFGHGPRLQRTLLEEEGVLFDAEGLIDLGHLQWIPEEEWLLSRGLLPPAG